VDYLKAKNDLIDKKIAEDNYYSDVIFRLDILDKKIALCDEDIELYSSLVDEFDEQFQAGLKTKDDLDMMKNSKSIKELDKKIFDIQKSIELLKLYEKIEN
jgi:transcription initiation factor IIE alpha subunit